MRFQQLIERYRLDAPASYGVDPDAVPAGLGDDLVARLRFAFMAEIIVDEFIAVDDDREILLEFLELFFRWFRSRIGLFSLGGDLLRIDGFDELRIGLFLVQYGKELPLYLFLGIFLADLIAGRMEQRKSEQLEMLVQFLQRLSDELIPLFVLEELHEIILRSGGMEKLQSMFIGGIFVLEGIYLDDVSCLRDVADRFDLAVDDGVLERESDIAMHGEREIQHCASHRQFDDISLRRIQEDAFLEDLDIELLLELLLVVERLVVVDDLLQFPDPFALLLGDSYRRVVLHVREMRRHSEFGDIVHLVRPDLDLRRETKHSQHRRMDALVAIEFRHRDIVLDLLDQRRVMLVDDAEHHVAVAHGIGDHPVSEQIHHRADLGRLVSMLELFVDSVWALDPSFDLEIVYAFLLEQVGDEFDAFLCVFLTLAEIFFEVIEDIVECLLFKDLERSVFEI